MGIGGESPNLGPPSGIGVIAIQYNKRAGQMPEVNMQGYDVGLDKQGGKKYWSSTT